MAETSAIEWTDATVNFWWGCTKVGPGCDRCYAEGVAARFGKDLWGSGVPRSRIKSAIRLLHKLDNDRWLFERNHRRRRRVFVQSMADLFDNEVPDDWFADAWTALGLCTHLDLQIVTKRISMVEKRLAGRPWPAHAGLMISVVNQDEADRDVPRLLDLKQKLGIPWVGLSMEPLLGPVALYGGSEDRKQIWNWLSGETGTMHFDGPDFDYGPRLDWVIVGGESGKHARAMHPDWARSLRDQCAAAGVPFFFKQWGLRFPVGQIRSDGTVQEETVQGGHGNLHKSFAGRLLDGIEWSEFPRHG